MCVKKVKSYPPSQNLPCLFQSQRHSIISLLKRTLGGVPNRNQFNIPVHIEEEAGMLLCPLQKGELTDETALTAFYKKVIPG